VKPYYLTLRRLVMKEEKLAELQKKVFDAYMKKTPKSKQMYDRACRTLTGGVSGNTRLMEPYPVYMTHGRGSKEYDIDGHEYIDCFLCAGPLLLGHCHPEVMEGIKREFDRGLLLRNPDLGVECAELLKEIVPCAERVRFLNTGTEADIAVARIARAFTGKNKIIKFYGHYHGQDDQFLVAVGNSKDEATSLGTPKESLSNTILLRYHDIDVIRRKLDEDNDIAGVILDPVNSSGGIWPPSYEYLRELRQLTKERGVALIFDEVITGFRLSLGGAQEYYGVTPDLAVFSKSIAGGEKLGAVVGKEEIMNAILTSGKEKAVFQSGTFIDCTVALAGGIAAMKVFKKLNEEGEYQRLFQLSDKLKLGIETVLRQRGVPCHVNHIGPCLKLYVTDLEPNFEAYCNLDKRISYLLFLSLMTEGVLLSWPSAGYTFLSFAHTEEDVQRVIDAINASLDKNKFEEVV